MATSNEQTEFDSLREDIDRIVKRIRATGDLKLLNVGTDRPDEHHWRFRTACGQIVMLTMERER